MPEVDPKRLEAEQRAHQASRILQDPLFQEALAGLEKRILAAWRNSKLDQAELREELWKQLRAADQVVLDLTRHLTTGKLTPKTADGQPSDGGT